MEKKTNGMAMYVRPIPPKQQGLLPAAATEGIDVSKPGAAAGSPTRALAGGATKQRGIYSEVLGGSNLYSVRVATSGPKPKSVQNLARLQPVPPARTFQHNTLENKVDAGDQKVSAARVTNALVVMLTQGSCNWLFRFASRCMSSRVLLIAPGLSSCVYYLLPKHHYHQPCFSSEKHKRHVRWSPR